MKRGVLKGCVRSVDVVGFNHCYWGDSSYDVGDDVVYYCYRAATR